jgi:hypothetical protein
LKYVEIRFFTGRLSGLQLFLDFRVAAMTAPIQE